jgi:hypothetical protein
MRCPLQLRGVLLPRLLRSQRTLSDYHPYSNIPHGTRSSTNLIVFASSLNHQYLRIRAILTTFSNPLIGQHYSLQEVIMGTLGNLTPLVILFAVVAGLAYIGYHVSPPY